MNATKLFIPDKLRVGFNNRKDTYNGQLAFVTYYDKAGKLRQAESFERWRDKKIAVKELDNKPTDGFVLNRSGGGSRESSGWNPRNEFIRVYDPRGFEFEISLPNLLFILRETDCSRGKGLHGQFVYAWDRSKLVLLPVDAAEFQQSQQFTGLQGQKISAKSLRPGLVYETRQQERWMFLGRRDCHFMSRVDDPVSVKSPVKKFVFLNMATTRKTWRGDAEMSFHQRLIFRNDPGTIARALTDSEHTDYAATITELENLPVSSPIVRVRLVVPKSPPANVDGSSFWVQLGQDVFECWSPEFGIDSVTNKRDLPIGYISGHCVRLTNRGWQLDTGYSEVKRCFPACGFAPSAICPPWKANRLRVIGNENDRPTPNAAKLMVRLANGREISYDANSFHRP